MTTPVTTKITHLSITRSNQLRYGYRLAPSIALTSAVGSFTVNKAGVKAWTDAFMGLKPERGGDKDAPAE